MMVLIVSTITTGVFAQSRPQKSELTDEQKEQMQVVREKYAEDLKELRGEMQLIATQQKVLLSSKTIDEKAIYANIDKIGMLKANMQKQMLAMHGEMKTIVPDAQKGKRSHSMKKSSGHRDSKMHQGKTAQRGQRPQENASKGRQHQGRNMNAPCTANAKGKENNRAKGLNLDIDQAEQIGEIKKAHFWTIQETKNEIALLKAESKNAENKEKAIDELSQLQTKLAKQVMAVKIETMNVLTEEQRMKMIATKGKQGPSKRGRGMSRAHQRHI